MKVNRFIWILGLMLAFSFFIPYQGWSQMTPNIGGAQPKPGTHAPIITNAFAVDKGHNGYIWKIYIEGEDPDGDMLRIASVVEQPGMGRYPIDWIFIKPPFQKHFKGFLQWNTYGAYAFDLREWTSITLKVSIFDKVGNESKEVILPFTFQTGVKDPYNYQLPAPFDQGNLVRLGYIDINLFDSFSTATAPVGYRIAD
jgi:hypothetical protein